MLDALYMKELLINALLTYENIKEQFNYEDSLVISMSIAEESIKYFLSIVQTAIDINGIDENIQ